MKSGTESERWAEIEANKLLSVVLVAVCEALIKTKGCYFNTKLQTLVQCAVDSLHITAVAYIYKFLCKLFLFLSHETFYFLHYKSFIYFYCD